MKKNVAVIMGGFSSEKEISLKSGKVIFDNINRSKYNPFKIIVISSYPEIFYNNPRIWKCFGVRGSGLYLSRMRV